MKSGIYKILNLVSEKIYIGSAVNIKNRWCQHRNSLKYNKHKNRHLQSAWNLHGKDAFVFEVVELCEKEVIIEREQFWLDETKCYDRSIGYNLNKTASSMLGHKHSEATKLKFKNRIYTDEIKANMFKGQTGKKHGPEMKAKIKALHTGKTVSQDAKDRIGSFNKGKTLPDETKMLISNANKGRKLTKEQIDSRYKERNSFFDNLTSTPIMLTK